MGLARAVDQKPTCDFSMWPELKIYWLGMKGKSPERENQEEAIQPLYNVAWEESQCCICCILLVKAVIKACSCSKEEKIDLFNGRRPMSRL